MNSFRPATPDGADCFFKRLERARLQLMEDELALSLRLGCRSTVMSQQEVWFRYGRT